MKDSTVFIWSGNPPRCEKVKNGEITNQSIFQQELTDPVKGNLWDVKEGKCLVHKDCDCTMLAITHIDVIIIGNTKAVRETARKIQDAYVEHYKPVMKQLSEEDR